MTPVALASLSPEIANGGFLLKEMPQQPSHALLHDIQKGHDKLGRTLNRDSALGVAGRGSNAGSNDMVPTVQSQSQYGGLRSDYMPMDKRGSIGKISGADRRPSKSPVPNKKNSSNQNGITSANSQK